MEQDRASSGLGTSKDPPGGARDASDAFKQPDRLWIKTSYGDGERKGLDPNKRRLRVSVSHMYICGSVSFFNEQPYKVPHPYCPPIPECLALYDGVTL